MNDPFYPQQNTIGEQVNVHSAVSQSQLLANQTQQMQYQMEEAEKSLADSQLDCDKTLNDLYHNLRQDVLKPVGNIIDWVPCPDPKRRVFTDDGVDKIMQIMKNYINKETLLSNFDDKTIARRMLEFSLAFSGIIFLKYEIYFRTPSMTECQEILQTRINQKIEKRRMIAQLLKKDFDLKAVEKEILDEVEQIMDYELQKIKEEQTKLNLREFEMMFTHLKHLVESTHNRAWKGEERGSLRRHFNISEVIGGNPNQGAPKRSFWGLK